MLGSVLSIKDVIGCAKYISYGASTRHNMDS